MTNTFAPNGFQQVARQDGVTGNFGQTTNQISSANNHILTFGDPVVQLGTGYLDIATAGTTSVAGIFAGCRYQSIAQGRTVWSRQYLGSDASGNIEAYVINDPNAVFLVQVGASGQGPVDISGVGANIQFAIGSPNTTIGLSGAYVIFTSLSTTSTLPFRVLPLLSTNPADLAMNNDNTTANNWIRVAFNFQDFKQTTGV